MEVRSHFIPQFIIRRFSENIKVFNKDTGEVASKNLKRVFYEKGKYTLDVEDTLNKKMEVHFARIVRDKLLKDEIVVTREELILIKKFMFITSIRAQTPEFVKKLLLSLEPNTDRYLKLMRSVYPNINQLEKTKESKLSDYDIFNNALAALADYDYKSPESTFSLFNDKRLTLEMAAYATSFFFSYVAFWDTPEDSEFLLGDGGMVSEYEGFHLITGGIDISKMSYLIHQINHDSENRNLYGIELANSSMMYENYDIFNISSTRSIVAINPFFRLYSKPLFAIGNKIVQLPVPDIWPAVIQNKELFEMPKNNKVLPHEYLQQDTFTYKPKKLDQKSLIYLNSLIYKQSKKLIGFSNPAKVYKTFNYILNDEAHYLSVEKMDDSENNVIHGYFDSLFTHKLNNLLNWCEAKGCKLDFDPEPLFAELTNNIYLDFRSNVYIYEFLLERYQETYENNALDFIGNFNKARKMEIIKAKYDELRTKRTT